ncbi:dihydroorotase [Candidatus Liberibacter asiaticus]|uniref:Dihydroorotase n=2 Tax=Liberibacter asiaticus TaxID=34021 RepID=C6XGI2_LIBAP|nr:dihydroorotase [Candidatus Liberibacter asiaticus]ACT57485.1 dihydroorotase [Candidatus Liberibacter asiaticus str. psy62]AGH17251.1 dihydroorotase [Candidatus Liberibacter asiaticus str. gxpsy]ALK07545.1 dihydroorotase [Candidatus Liberibacter asiaticus]ASK53038.1 dihydroorotase [Candidatus Liberibacter asiaticus]AWL14362.1 dihydroorotase [Candidatus Liberibacter asiaticus]
MKKISLRVPDDWHLHLRDGEILKTVLRDTAKNFRRALVMPNIDPPIITVDDACAYRQRILNALPPEYDFSPLMTIYLTETTDPDDVEKGFTSQLVQAIKLYFAGSTTNSHHGIRNIDRVMPVLERMETIGMPLCIHGEILNQDIDIFDRELMFIDKILDPLRNKLPNLKIILEHITTSNGIDYVNNATNIAGSITVHHLIINRNAIFHDGLNPHYYCLPIPKREKHRLSLRKAALSGNPRFFLGTDSAPHWDSSKESSCGCAGIYTARNALNCLAQIFEEENKLENLESFVSINGATWYGIPVNTRKISLKRREQPIIFDEKITTSTGSITIFNPIFPLYWEVMLHDNL